MDLKDLEYTLAIAKYRSISKAAKELFLSQPYLSSKLKSLEKELGIQIFRRTSTGIIPTASGEELLNSAAKIHSEVEYIRRLKARSSCRLDIVSYYRPFFFNCFLRFQGNFPVEGSESFKELSLKECFQALNSGAARLAPVCYASNTHAIYEKMARSYHCTVKKLFPDVRLSVIMRKGHPLSGHSCVTPEDMFRFPLVCFNDSLPFFRHIELTDFSGILYVSDRGGFFDTLENSDSIGVLAILGEEPVKQDICYVPLESKYNTLDFLYATADNYQPNPREEQFLADFRSCRNVFFRLHQYDVSIFIFRTENHSFGKHACQLRRFQVDKNHNFLSDHLFR